MCFLVFEVEKPGNKIKSWAFFIAKTGDMSKIPVFVI